MSIKKLGTSINFYMDNCFSEKMVGDLKYGVVRTEKGGMCFFFVLQKKLVPMRQTLQQMGACMMTQVNHIQALMNLCECSETSHSMQPQSVRAVVDSVSSVIKYSTSQKQETSESRSNPAPPSTLTA